MSNEYFTARTNEVMRVGWFDLDEADFARTPGKLEDGIEHLVRIKLGNSHGNDCWLTGKQAVELATALLQMASELRDVANNIPARDE